MVATVYGSLFLNIFTLETQIYKRKQYNKPLCTIIISNLASFANLVGEGNGTPLQYSLPGKSHGRRSLAGCSPWGRKESDRTERLHFQFSLSCIWEGNGNPLQCSCLENPRDGGAWWAAVNGVAQSWTRVKWLISSSQSCFIKTSEFLPRYCNSNTRYYIISRIKSSAFTSNRIFFF